MIETTEDGFLGGQLMLEQPKSGYRAGADPVFLAATVPALPGQSVLDLGVGVGVALFSLCHRVPGLEAVGIDLQEEMCVLARRNAERNSLRESLAEDMRQFQETFGFDVSKWGF